MLKVGITGGIGSGKTTACQLFEQKWGIPIYYADDRAKWLMLHSPELVAGIKAAFGDQAYLPNGELNRPFLAQTVFADKEQLAVLNSLVHPAVFLDGEQWMQEQAAKGVPYALKEAALLVETGSYQLMDKLIVVTAPLDVRVQRAMQRDNADEQTIRARIQHQLPDEEKIKVADFVLNNGDGLAALEQEVERIHQALIAGSLFADSQVRFFGF